MLDVEQMMPIPTHLKGIAHSTSDIVDEEPLHADLKCECGSRSFEVLYPGQTHEWKGDQVPCTAQVDDKFFFLEDREFGEKYIFLKHRFCLHLYFRSPLGLETSRIDRLTEAERFDEERFVEFVEQEGGHSRSVPIPF